jgi:hypothetical protein
MLLTSLDDASPVLCEVAALDIGKPYAPIAKSPAIKTMPSKFEEPRPPERACRSLLRDVPSDRSRVPPSRFAGREARRIGTSTPVNVSVPCFASLASAWQ